VYEDVRDCPDLATLSAMHDGECPDAEARLLRKHLEACVGCRGTLAALAASDVWVREADPAAGLGDLDVERMVGSVRDAASGNAGVPAGSRRLSRGVRRVVRRVALASATLAAAVILAVILTSRNEKNRRDADRLPERSTGSVAVAPDVETGREPSSPIEPVQARDPGDSVPGGPAAGVRTLARLDEEWPRRCRAEAREILETSGPEFDGSASQADAVFERMRPLGRYALSSLRSGIRDDRSEVSLLAFEILLRFRFDSSLEDLAFGAERHDRLDDLLAAIDDLASPHSVGFLANLAVEDPSRRARAVEILGSIPGRDALDALVALATSGGEDGRVDPDAVAAIASRSGADAMRALIRLHGATDGDPVVELAIRSDAAAALPHVRRSLADARSADFESALELAGILEDRRSVAPLLGLLRDDRWRGPAIRSLLKIGDARSLPEVLLCLDPEAEDPGVMARIARSIGSETLDGLERLAARKKGETGRKAALLLVRAGPRATPHLGAVLRSGHHRAEMIGALAHYDTEESRGILSSALADPARGDRVLEDLVDGGHGELAIALLQTMLEEGGSARTRRALARLERSVGDRADAAPE
jgi:hypothetical protein